MANVPVWATPPHRPNRSGFWVNSFYNLDVSALPLDGNSASIISSTISAHNSIGPWIRCNTFGTNEWNTSWENNAPAKYFIDTLPADRDPETSRVNWTLVDVDGSTANPHLFWPGLRQEGCQKNPLTGGVAPVPPWVSTIDKHAVLWSEDSDELVEAIQFWGGYNNQYKAEAMSIVNWDLSTYSLAMQVDGGPAGVVAARIPVAPFAFTYQDLLDCGTTGELGHMLGIVLANYRNTFTWPARSSDGTLSSGLPAGGVIRLKSSFNLNTIPPGPLRALVRTMQKRGIMVFDKNLGRPTLFIPNDPAWPNNFGDPLDNILTFDNFEVVSLSSVAGSANTIQVTSGSTPPPDPDPDPPSEPVANGSASVFSGSTPLSVTFSSAGSLNATSYLWDFDDGTTSTSANPVHAFSEPGTYNVVLTVSDGIDTDTETMVINVYAAPVDPNEVEPPADLTSAAGGRTGWVFWDGTVDPPEVYVMPVNPHTDSGSHAYTRGVKYQARNPSISYRDTSGKDHIADTVIFPGSVEQETFTYDGFTYDTAQLIALYYWTQKGYPFYLADDLGRLFKVFFTNLKIDRVRSNSNRLKHSYSLSGIVLEEIILED